MTIILTPNDLALSAAPGAAQSANFDWFISIRHPIFESLLAESYPKRYKKRSAASGAALRGFQDWANGHNC